MSFEELLEEKLPEEDELYVVDAIYAISRLKSRATEDWRQGLSDVVRHWVCVISRPYYFREEVCPGVEMKSTKLVLLTYKAETVRPLGEAHMKVEYIGSQYTLLFELYVRELVLCLVETVLQIST